MAEKTHRSKCRNAEVRADGIPDFLGSKEVCTVSYTCLKCDKSCDVAKPEDQKRKMRAAKQSKEKKTTLTTKKRIEEGEKRLNFQGKVLQKLVEFFDGIIIHPAKGVILTSKKKRQLAELQKMEQRFFKSK